MKLSLLKDLVFANALNMERREIKEAVFTNAITEEPVRIPVDRYVEVRDGILANKALHLSVFIKGITWLLKQLIMVMLLSPLAIAVYWVVGVLVAPDVFYTTGLEWSPELIQALAVRGLQISVTFWLCTVFVKTLVNQPMQAVYSNLLKHKLISELPQVNDPDLYYCGKPEKFKLASAQLARL